MMWGFREWYVAIVGAIVFAALMIVLLDRAWRAFRDWQDTRWRRNPNSRLEPRRAAEKVAGKRHTAKRASGGK